MGQSMDDVYTDSTKLAVRIAVFLVKPYQTGFFKETLFGPPSTLMLQQSLGTAKARELV
jgi:hypothetical protein